MRILILSWEYPPQIIGGLGRHVDRLSESLAAEGHEVHVLTRDAPGLPDAEQIGRVHVHRVPEYPPRVPFDDLVPWVLQFNLGLVQRGVQMLHGRQIDVIHAHDWLVAYAAASLHELFNVPLVGTVHATEYGRHQGYLPGPMNRLIHQVEWWLTYVARRVITCSPYMRDQVRDIFELPPAKLDVVANGVALRMDASDVGNDSVHDRDPMVLFAGRLEYEKGVQTLIEAAPQILDRYPDARFVIAGDGTFGDELQKLVAECGLGDSFDFRGFCDDESMPALYREASVVVAPSIYEPFGIVALEAMAARVPVIVGGTGGLREIVRDGENGLHVPPEDAAALAGSVARILGDPELRARLVEGGSKTSRTRTWRTIARQTVDVYNRAIVEEREFREAFEERPPLRLVWDASAAYRETVLSDDGFDTEEEASS